MIKTVNTWKGWSHKQHTVAWQIPQSLQNTFLQVFSSRRRDLMNSVNWKFGSLMMVFSCISDNEVCYDHLLCFGTTFPALSIVALLGWHRSILAVCCVRYFPHTWHLTRQHRVITQQSYTQGGYLNRVAAVTQISLSGLASSSVKNVTIWNNELFWCWKIILKLCKEQVRNKDLIHWVAGILNQK